MHMGIHMGMENVSHRKSFHPHDFGDVLFHFDFSQIGDFWLYTPVSADTQDSYTDTGSVTSIRLTGVLPKDIDTPVSGIVKINNEYFSYSSVNTSGGFVDTLNGVTRAVAGSTAQAHTAGDVVTFLRGDFDGNYDFSTWSTDQFRINCSAGTGRYLTHREATANMPTKAITNLGTPSRPTLYWDGSSDRLEFDSVVNTTNGDFSIVVIFRASGTIGADAILAGSSGGVNQFKLQTNTWLFRCNGDGTSTNDFSQLKLHSTKTYAVGSRGVSVDKGGAGDAHLVDENELAIFIKEKNSIDNKEKVYCYDAKNFTGEDLLNTTPTVDHSGYPDGVANPTNTDMQFEYIGGFDSDGSPLESYVSEILVYDRALSAEEVPLLQEYYDNLYPNLRHD